MMEEKVDGPWRKCMALGFDPYYESLKKEMGQKEMLIFYVLHGYEYGIGKKTSLG